MKAFALGLSFLTRLPVGPDELAPGLLGRSTRAWPVAGSLVGIAAIAALTAGSWLASPMVGAVAAVGAIAWATGGLHLDGLSDCFDGWHVNGDATRRLAVMRDPRVGGLGAALTALSVVAKVALVAACAERGTAAPALWVAAIVARATLPFDVLREPAATPGQGLFAAVKAEATRVDAAISGVVGAFLLTPALLVDRSRVATALAIVAAGLAGVLWTRAWRRRIGGCNGDVLGAGVELREAAVLLAFAVPLTS